MCSYNHEIFRLLCDLGIIDANHIEPYALKVRDRDDVAAFRCPKSGVIFLDKIDQAQNSYYVGKDVQSGTMPIEDSQIPFHELDNDRRKSDAFGDLIKDKCWLDFGCGTGSFLEHFAPHCKEAWGVELNETHRIKATERGIHVIADIADLPESGFDIITLFHVFEHLADPVSIARQLRKCLRPNGVLLVEVPHARDFLLETLDCSAFRSFTLWSEHLILHTQESLKTLLCAAGFDNVEITGHQRFPLSNHLYWLRHGKPGGHEKWDFLDSPELSQAYRATLERIEQTDTIVALARA